VEESLLGRAPSAELFHEAGEMAAAEMVRQAGRRWSSTYKEPALAALVTRGLTQVFDGQEPRQEPSQEPRQGAGDTRPLPAAVESRAWPKPQPIVVEGQGKIELTLNGRQISAGVPANTRLIDLLRDQLGLTGTKEGCSVGECGACSVLLDGRVVNACLVLSAQAAGREVVTIEGIRGADSGPNDLQQAFIDYGAVQCGYCTPGMVMAGEALLATHPSPSRSQIREAIAGNLCRCTGYQQIVDAIEATAAKRTTTRAAFAQDARP
jgi:carbon-monoxide dehydrogenase small subunit